MNKVWLIIRREYITRIRHKTFIWSTLLMPVLFLLIIGVSIYMNTRSTEEVSVAVWDESGLFAGQLKDNKNVSYHEVPAEVFQALFSGSEEKSSFDGGLHIPALNIDQPAGVTYLSEKQISVFTQDKINKDLNGILENARMIRANIDTAQLSKIRSNPISLVQKSPAKDGIESKENHAVLSYIMGYGSGIFIYFILIIYGSMVMRGVMEEKTNRIAEVIISSARPVQLMMGKIIGIGAVGLTQCLLWAVLILSGYFALASFITVPADMQQLAPAGIQPVQEAASQEELARLIASVRDLNLPLLAGAFFFYFIGGYLFYAALFAAVGSVVNEDSQDVQSLMMPIMMPIIFSIVIMSGAIANPTGSLAVWASIIPFTSPVIMMARLPFGVPGTVPYYQLILSVLMLAAGFLCTIWLSARIYRTGILMYGKKASWKELARWAFRKQ